MAETTVEILKDGLWAVNPPNPGEVRVTKGEVRTDLSRSLIKRMLEAESNDESGPCIKIIHKDQPKPKKGDDTLESSHVLDDVSDIRATLLEVVDSADGKNDAKDKLEEWGRDNLSFEVDKRRSLENVIADLISEYEDQNG